MPFVELSTKQQEEMSISADGVLALMRGAGFDVPEDAVLVSRCIGGTGNTIVLPVDSLFIIRDLPPTVQRVKVSSSRE